MSMILDQNDAVAMLHERLDSHDWWIIPYLGEVSSDTIDRLERDFYGGEKSVDFEIVMGSIGPILGVAMAHKRQASIPEMARFFAKIHHESTPSTWEEMLKTQDVLCFLDQENAEHEQLLALVWIAWMDEHKSE